MKNFIRGLGVASILALGSAGVANADAMSMMQGYAACNTGYMQCLGASDMTMASTPNEGVEKMRMNMSHAQQCASALQACYSAVQ